MTYKRIFIRILSCFLRIARPTRALRDFLLWPVLSRLVGVTYTQVQRATAHYYMEVGMEDVLNRFLLVYAPFWDPCWEPQTTKFARMIATFSRRVILAGGHIGYTALEIMEGLRAHSEAVMDVCEPVPSLARRLQANIAMNHLESSIRLHGLALSNKDGVAEICVDSIRSSLVEGSRGVKELVPTRTLESIIASRLDAGIDFLFLDIEGYELLVLRAADRIITEQKPDMILEVSPKILSKTSMKDEELYVFLEDRGYRVYIIDDDYHLQHLPRIIDQRVRIVERHHSRAKPLWNSLYFNIYASALDDRELRNRFPEVEIIC